MFILKDSHDDRHSLVWTAISYGANVAPVSLKRPEAAVLDRLTTDRETASALHALMHPGLVMVITDDPAPEMSRSGRSFVIATHFEPEDWKTRVLEN
jgi:hypothetical protein